MTSGDAVDESSVVSALVALKMSKLLLKPKRRACLAEGLELRCVYAWSIGIGRPGNQGKRQ